MLGEQGITDELDALGVPWVGGPDPAFKRDFDAGADFSAIASGAALDPHGESRVVVRGGWLGDGHGDADSQS